MEGLTDEKDNSFSPETEGEPADEPDDEEEVETTFAELEASNDSVEFDALAPGKTVSLSAPDPRTSGAGLPDSAPLYGVRHAVPRDGSSVLPSTCSCEWLGGSAYL